MARLKKLEEKFLTQDSTNFVDNLAKPSLHIETKSIESKSRAEEERYSVYNTVFAFLFKFFCRSYWDDKAESAITSFQNFRSPYDKEVVNWLDRQAKYHCI